MSVGWSSSSHATLNIVHSVHYISGRNNANTSWIFLKSLLEYPGNLLEICSVKSVDTLFYRLEYESFAYLFNAAVRWCLNTRVSCLQSVSTPSCVSLTPPRTQTSTCETSRSFRNLGELLWVVLLYQLFLLDAQQTAFFIVYTDIQSTSLSVAYNITLCTVI